ncbi:MAG: sulfate respiration complex protein HmcE [Syntrophobacter sp.]
MYGFITGLLLWLSFATLVIGLTVRTVVYIRGLDWQVDRVAYGTHMALGFREATRSIVHWLLPFWSVGWRAKPLFTIIFFVFHTGLLLTPVFLIGHAVLIKERFGINWPTIPMGLADVLTVLVMCSVLFIAVRRMALPEVRIVTTAYDYLLLLITAAPFVTGFLLVHQVADHRLWLYAHILSAELLLIAIPFTKLYHVVGFFLSRGQLGMDFGIKRGFKGDGFDW